MRPSKKSLELVIIGPSGGGKGTQAEKIAEKYNLVHISVGEAFRREIKSGSELGKKAKIFVDKGEWVPTNLTIKIVNQELSKTNYQNFILDGCPRLPDQPQGLDNLLEKKNQDLDLVMHLKVADEEIMRRRKEAWQKGKNFYDQDRNDENLTAIKERLKSYHQTIGPIIDYYQEKGILAKINGNRPIEPIFTDIVSSIEKNLL